MKTAKSILIDLDRPAEGAVVMLGQPSPYPENIKSNN
jgi:hypothetical protein